jgi:hypothetical protein
MPTVKLEKSTNHTPDEAFKKISNLLENDSELRKLDPKYVCEFNPSNHSGTAKGSQFKASMNITPSSKGSNVLVSVELPFHLALVKGLVSKTLDKKLDEALS